MVKEISKLYGLPHTSVINDQSAKYVVKIHQIFTLGPAAVPSHQLSCVNYGHRKFHSFLPDRIFAKLYTSSTPYEIGEREIKLSKRTNKIIDIE